MSEQAPPGLFTATALTAEQIGKFRWKLPEAAWKLRHDCLVAVGARASPHKGGKLEARQRVADAMNAKVTRRNENQAVKGIPMGEHIVDGEFQSDKYPTTPPGLVPLSVRDPTAQDLLWEYAQRRRAVDADFAADLETCLRAAGYAPPPTCG